ncbi:efflux RND transporter periplasmic adaptor subunit [Alteromonas sp. KUL49]|uniref:efflux RND transporter periplasmic adaptor subunit n=1 Tax=Alteromonas sp. KUL49 TaxID=2480798 RepID=UPI0010FFBFE7|nr:efflux RND transporter periplasmic adaptor subunit [Alteromonas sp. KUL49]GEA13539.1 hemolysin secretion protein D [Alteromonas sp. KUL49]
MKNSFMKTWKKAAVISALIGVLGACGKPEVIDNNEPVLRPVRTMVVELAESGPFKEFTAVVDASQKVNLAFKISGRIIELPVKAGDPVSEGQLIARLDDTDIKVELAEAESSFNKARSDFNRGKELIVNNSISQADFDQLQANYNSASAQLESIRNKLAYTRLEASFDGVIAQRFVENFEEIQGQSPIAALHDIGNINFNVDVPESILINVRPESAPPKVTAVFESIPETVFDLTFKEISTQADDVTKTYEVVFTMPNSTEHTILPGMSARVRVMNSNTEQNVARFYVPEHAVLQDSKGNYVYTVSSSGEGIGTISRQDVVIGNITAWGIEVYSGIEDGQHLVTAGMSKVQGGMTVKFEQ